MSCVPSNPRFRLLDHRVGWDAAHHEGLTGLQDGAGVRLEGGPNGIGPEALDPYLPPPRLSPGCRPCDVYLVTRSGIKALDGCSNTWRPAWPRSCVPVVFDKAVAVAVDRDRIAVADAGAGRVWVMRLKEAQVVAEITVDRPRDLSFGPAGEIVVAAGDGAALLRFTFNGRRLGPWPAPLPGAGPIARIAHDREGRLWLALEAGPGRFALFGQQTRHNPVFLPRAAQDLAAAFEHTATVRSNRAGFCLRRGGGDGAMTTFCWDWSGHAIPTERVQGTSAAAFVIQGQLLTHAIDSGIPRCRWHRLVIDAEIPAGTRVSVAVATSEVPTPAAQGVPDPGWATFPAGRPHPGDWQSIEPGQTDTLIRCPPGRYLFLRLRLSGDGRATPRVHRIHLDFPRTTSADLLPVIFREDGVAADFTERFLSLFDTTLGSVDAAVARFPALLDGARARDEVLPWIARFLAVTLDESWDADRRRAMLRAAPDLFRRRGTRTGLSRSIRLAYGLAGDPTTTEHGLERIWGAVAAPGTSSPADARLGHTRLFSRRSARLTLGASPLARTPVMSYGNPAADPHEAGAFRFSVELPASAGADAVSLARLVEGQKPAHTVATIRVGGTNGFRLGGVLRLGVDTLLIRPRPQVLGDQGSRLAQNSILGGLVAPAAIVGRNDLTEPGPAAFPYPVRSDCHEKP
ncbi:MAG TPA: phage tail protein [Gammaproteobacteria bacterium]|nr:phage tail protein [Gammaproteobacteria bacterium]